MSLFGFYSNEQRRIIMYIPELGQSRSRYTNPNGKILFVTQAEKFNDKRESLYYFMNTYLKIFPDGKFIGQLVEYIDEFP